MVRFLKISLVAALGTPYTLAGEGTMIAPRDNHDQPHHQQSKKFKLDSPDSLPLKMVEKDTHRLQKIQYYEEQGITNNQKTYSVLIPETLKRDLQQDDALQQELIDSIEKISRSQPIEEGIVGFKFFLYNRKIHKSAFRGENAK